MGRMVLICLIVFSCVVTAYQQSGARGNDYRTFEIIAISDGILTLRDSDGNTIEVDRDSEDFRVGYMVRYNARDNKLRKGVIRTYDWQEFYVKKLQENRIVLVNDAGENLILENIYGVKVQEGDRVKYDRINNLLKKIR